MASTQNALICAALATVLWGCIGWPVASRLFAGSLAVAVAPLLGWAVHSAVVLPIFFIVGLSRTSLSIVIALSLIMAVVAWWKRPHPMSGETAAHIPVWAVAAAAVLAWAIMDMILPTISANGVSLANPVFDHSKVAMIDEMVRLGVPPGNPFFAATGDLTRLSYYYLWHFSAAELSILTGLSGWDADAGMTWFTAFSTLMLMMGLATWFSSRSSAAGWTLALAATASIRPIIGAVIGWELTYTLTGWPSGFGAWLFQVTWAPQHVASAGCVVIAILLLVQMAQRQSLLLAIVLSLVVAAGFQSSTWVGGITFALAALVIGPLILIKIGPSDRRSFVVYATFAAVIAVLLVSPFLYDQFLASLIRADGAPIAFARNELFGEDVPEKLRPLLDILAYWTIFLLVEFAALYPLGVMMAFWLATDPLLSRERTTAMIMLGSLAAVSLMAGGFLASKIGVNNDLAWRAVLPAVIVLIVTAAAGLSRYLKTIGAVWSVLVIGAVGLGTWEGVRQIRDNNDVEPKRASAEFLNSVRMWNAVRMHSTASDRIANDPLFLKDMTIWPVNISWALLANRRSCYAGEQLALPFVPLPRERRKQIDEQFNRVFAGMGDANDVRDFAETYSCNIVVITSQDGAWARDPFALSPRYRLVETEQERWRIYKRN